MRSKVLTPSQLQLFNLIRPLMVDAYNDIKDPLTYEEIKSLVNFKSFDSSFNAILDKGYIFRYPTNDFSNRFMLSKEYNY